jgi:ACDE family multidrug resistance protein
VSTRPAAAGRQLWPLYAGGFLGPFGGAMVTPMLPELRDGLHTTLTVAAWALTSYMIPFASIMLVSGTLAERWGRHRTVRLAYLAYAGASLLCALAPTTGLFMAGRGLQGAANAFTSPLLVAAISDLVPRDRLGRSLGSYGSMQAAGQAFAPLVGGAAAALDYRLAFLASMAAAIALSLVPPPDTGVVTSVVPAGTGPRAGHAEISVSGSTTSGSTTSGSGVSGSGVSGPGVSGPGVSGPSAADRWRVLLNRRLAVACAVAFSLYLATSGLMLLVALLAGDRFGLGSDARGLVVAAFGVAGLLGGSALGRLADRFGIRPFGVAALLVLAVAIALSGTAGTVAMLVAMVALSGAASTGGRLMVNTLAVTSTPGNRGGATSITLSWQFLGSALSPLILLPIYTAAAGTGFLTTAAAALVGAGLLLAAPLLSGVRAPRDPAVAVG